MTDSGTSSTRHKRPAVDKPPVPSRNASPLQANFPDHRIESIAALRPYANNARTHSPEQVGKIAASIREFGFTNPILIDGQGGIIAGHGRVLAATILGMDTVPVIDLSHLSDAQRRAYILADNRLALDAGWDEARLAVELGELQLEGFDLALTGFELGEIATLLDTTEGLTDPDDVPDVPAEPVARLGDVWRLGRHTLVCGDSTTSEAVDACLGAVKPHLMVTDPPYGVDFDPTWRKGSEKRAYMGDAPDKEFLWREVWALFPGDVVYIWHAAERTGAMWQCLSDLGFEYRAQIIWNKDRFIIGHGHYCYNHEPCFYGVRKKATGHWQGARDQPTIWTIKHQKSDTNHGAQKPVECMKRPIENNSSAGQAVYEPFSGSGTTIIAGEMTGRSVHAIELSPAHVDCGILRWQNFTGLEATLDHDGRTFADHAAERVPHAPQA